MRVAHRSNEQQIYEFIIQYRRATGGNSPSYRQICRATGIDSTSVVFRAVEKLIEDGYLYKKDSRICVSKDRTPKWIE